MRYSLVALTLNYFIVCFITLHCVVMFLGTLIMKILWGLEWELKLVNISSVLPEWQVLCFIWLNDTPLTSLKLECKLLESSLMSTKLWNNVWHIPSTHKYLFTWIHCLALLLNRFWLTHSFIEDVVRDCCKVFSINNSCGFLLNYGLF